jgi:hypothetical protein
MNRKPATLAEATDLARPLLEAMQIRDPQEYDVSDYERRVRACSPDGRDPGWCEPLACPERALAAQETPAFAELMAHAEHDPDAHAALAWVARGLILGELPMSQPMLTWVAGRIMGDHPIPNARPHYYRRHETKIVIGAVRALERLQPLIASSTP